MKEENTITKLQVQRMLLIRAEDFVLVEYVECIVPLIFSIVLAGFYCFDSTNAQYIELYKGLDRSKILKLQQDLLIYAFSNALY